MCTALTATVPLQQLPRTSRVFPLAKSIARAAARESASRLDQEIRLTRGVVLTWRNGLMRLAWRSLLAAQKHHWGQQRERSLAANVEKVDTVDAVDRRLTLLLRSRPAVCSKSKHTWTRCFVAASFHCCRYLAFLLAIAAVGVAGSHSGRN